MGVSELQRVRRQQLLREVEGYLDLLLACEGQWPLSAKARDPLARRALGLLARVPRHRAPRAHVFYLEGLALRVLERYGEAVQPLQEAAELDPSRIEIWLLLGWCYKRCGRLDLAIQSLEEALEFESGEALIHYNLACYWSLANKPKQALRFLARAFHLDPQYRELVAEERDFDPIRKHPDFRDDQRDRIGNRLQVICR